MCRLLWSVAVVGSCDRCGGSVVVSWSPFPIAVVDNFVVGCAVAVVGSCGLAILGRCEMVGEALRSSSYEMSDLMRPLQQFTGHAPA